MGLIPPNTTYSYQKIFWFKLNLRHRETETETEIETETDRTQNSELYYTRIKILGSCLFLQSVPANLHASRLHIKQ